jgi:hypothetical protein
LWCMKLESKNRMLQKYAIYSLANKWRNWWTLMPEHTVLPFLLNKFPNNSVFTHSVSPWGIEKSITLISERIMWTKRAWSLHLNKKNKDPETLPHMIPRTMCKTEIGERSRQCSGRKRKKLDDLPKIRWQKSHPKK